MMNCFEWRSRASDYLDGTLIGAGKREADTHLDECEECAEIHSHYRIILRAVASQPRSTLPVPIRKSPFAAALPRLESHSRRTRWERTPWFIRTSVEGAAIAATIVFVIAMVPRIRTVYERSTERRLDTFNLADFKLDDDASKSARLERANPAGKAITQDPEASFDDYSGEDEHEDEPDDVAGTPASTPADRSQKAAAPVKAGRSEIWRFILKTDSPHEIRPKIVAMLMNHDISKDTPGIGGIEAPGGIQFDLLVPQSAIGEIKSQLQKLVPAAKPIDSHSGPTANFTWYKTKSSRQIPAGKSRIVIWLSLI